MTYATMIIEGNQEVWDQAIEISKLEQQEQAKYKVKNRNKLSRGKQELYKKKKGKFVKRRYKARYCEDSIPRPGRGNYSTRTSITNGGQF